MEFADIEHEVWKNVAGIYEVHMRNGVRLKVGIARDLRKRLCTHRASRQSGLRLRVGGAWTNPSDVTSKSSILAKHLYFDATLTDAYDLCTEHGRTAFLLEQCEIVVEVLPSRDAAAILERGRERSGAFRYVGRVIAR